MSHRHTSQDVLAALVPLSALDAKLCIAPRLFAVRCAEVVLLLIQQQAAYMMLAVNGSLQSLLENAETVPGLEGLGLLNVDMSGTVVGRRLVMMNWLFGAGASAMPGLLFASVHCASYLHLCLDFIPSACYHRKAQLNGRVAAPSVTC